MIRNRIILFSLLAFLLAGVRLEGQRLFGAGVLAGLNASQIQGDATGGYDKLGFRVGLRGIVRYSEKSEFGMDLLYSQRGSTNGLTSNNLGLRWVFHLDYVEVPVWICYKDWLTEEGYYRIKVFGGLSYGRLFNIRLVDHPTFPQDQVDNLNMDDLSFHLGLSYYLGRKFSLGVNYTHSVIPLYNNRKYLSPAGIPVYEYRLRGYFLTFQGVYEF